MVVVTADTFTVVVFVYSVTVVPVVVVVLDDDVIVVVVVVVVVVEGETVIVTAVDPVGTEMGVTLVVSHNTYARFEIWLHPF